MGPSMPFLQRSESDPTQIPVKSEFELQAHELQDYCLPSVAAWFEYSCGKR